MSTPVVMTNCLADELLAEFIDGRLKPADRRIVTEHIASCADCRDIVTAAWDLQQSEPDIVDAGGGAVIRGRFPWRYAATAAAAVVIVGGLLYQPIRQWYAVRSTGLPVIARAANDAEERPFRGRLSGDIEFKPSKRTFRGPDDEIDNYRLLDAAFKADATAQRYPSPETLNAAGVAYLLVEKRDEAVARLTEALRLDTGVNEIDAAITKSDNAALLANLAAAYQARWQYKGVEGDLELALKAADRAWTLEKLPAAAFTRAAALESMNRDQEAIAAWEHYLTIDATSQWAEEARTNIANLKEFGDVTLPPR